MYESHTSADSTTERSHGESGEVGEVVDAVPAGLDRRRFVGYVLGGATLVTAADLTLGRAPARGAIPSLPQIPEIYDLEDLQTDAALATSQLITVTIREDGTAAFALPRMEVGQGIVTSTAMILA